MRSRRVPSWMPLLAAVTVALLIFGIAFGVYWMVWSRAVEQAEHAQAEALDRFGFYIEARVRTRINDIFLLKGIVEEALAQGDFAEGIIDLRPAGKRLLLSRPVYRRLLFLDATGREKFVQLYQAGERPIVVEEETGNLANQSQDAAYLDTRAVSSAEATVSMPQDSTGTESRLVVGAQVINATGQMAGILILEADLHELVKSLEVVPIASEAQPILYTSDAIEIGPKGINMDESGPLPLEVWQQLQRRGHGSLFSGGFLYTFREIDPTSAAVAYPPLAMPIAHGERLHWIMLSKLPVSAIRQEIASACLALCGITALSLVLCVPGAWYAATVMRQRNIARNSLFQSEHLLQIASRMTKVGAWRLTFPHEKIFWSREVYQIFEVSSEFIPTVEALVGFLSSEESERLREALAWGQEKGEAFDLELRATSAKFRPLWIHILGEAETDRNGRLLNLSGTIQDVTAAKEAVAQERRLTAAAHVAERAKASFLAVMSHEIRTPMNGILGFADMLASRSLAPEDKEYVRIIQESGNALLRILDDILDYSRLEAGHLQVIASDFAPADIVETVTVLLSPLARHKSVTLSSNVEPGLPKLLYGDGGRIRQILLNLANNALKFTQKGEIVIGVRTAPEKPDRRPWLEFYVQDSGIGISPEKLDSIFEPFVQADGTISRRYGGTGLGLAISKSFAELLGGKIEVESAINVGSLFRLLVPLEPASKGHDYSGFSKLVLDASFARQYPLKILVVEDDPINMKLINQLLRQWGYEPLTAANGRDAVEKATSEKPDCIFMDLHMPEMDGLQAIELIRQAPKKENHPEIFIAALSADVMPEDQSLCLGCGADFYLTKPIKKPLLAHALQQASQRKKKN